MYPSSSGYHKTQTNSKQPALSPLLGSSCSFKIKRTLHIISGIRGFISGLFADFYKYTVSQYCV